MIMSQRRVYSRREYIDKESDEYVNVGEIGEIRDGVVEVEE